MGHHFLLTISSLGQGRYNIHYVEEAGICPKKKKIGGRQTVSEHSTELSIQIRSCITDILFSKLVKPFVTAAYSYLQNLYRFSSSKFRESTPKRKFQSP